MIAKLDRVRGILDAYLDVRDMELRRKRRADMRQAMNELGLDGIDSETSAATLDAILAKLGLEDTGTTKAFLRLVEHANAGLDPVFSNLQQTFEQIRAKPLRGMGKTTRQLLLGLEMMTVPEVVVNYLWPEPLSLSYPHHLFVHMLQQMRMGFVSRNPLPEEREVKLDRNGAVMRFMPVTRDPVRALRGHIGEGWILDHACHDLHPLLTSRWADRLQLIGDRPRPR